MRSAERVASPAQQEPPGVLGPPAAIRRRCHQITSALVVVMGLSTGCNATFYHGQRPIYPELGDKVDTLQPTLRWERAEDSQATYDLAVVVARDNWQKNTDDSYYREGLRDPEYRIEEPLKPSQIYYWAVRVRRGSDVTAWSSYETTHNSGLWTTTKSALHYYFTTPATPLAPVPATSN